VARDGIHNILVLWTDEPSTENVMPEQSEQDQPPMRHSMSDAVLLERDRYDPSILLSQLAAQMPGKDGDEWCFTFKYDGQHTDDFWAYLPDDTREHENARSRLAEFLAQIRQIDNLVQASFEAEYHATGVDLRDLKLHIGWLKVADQTITVRYWGTVVNTEWEVVFKRLETGQWVESNPAGRSAMYPTLQRSASSGPQVGLSRTRLSDTKRKPWWKFW
jgi:hypothetical protein